FAVTWSNDTPDAPLKFRPCPFVLLLKLQRVAFTTAFVTENTAPLPLLPSAVTSSKPAPPDAVKSSPLPLRLSLKLELNALRKPMLIDAVKPAAALPSDVMLPRVTDPCTAPSLIPVSFRDFTVKPSIIRSPTNGVSELRSAGPAAGKILTPLVVGT